MRTYEIQIFCFQFYRFLKTKRVIKNLIKLRQYVGCSECSLSEHVVWPLSLYCTARQCSPLRRKLRGCSIINPALSLLMKHLVIGQRQNAPNFSALHWSTHGCLVSICQHFVTPRVIHLPKRTETSLITESDPILESDQAVRALHGCNSWFSTRNNKKVASFLKSVISKI